MRLPRIFGGNPAPVETKESRAGVTLVQSPGQPAWMKRDTVAFSKEGYSQNVIAFRCVHATAQAASSVRWESWRGETEVTDSDIVKLFTRPNPKQTWGELIEAAVSNLRISGNCYFERVTLNGTLRELYVLRSDRMRVIEGAAGIPAGYEYEGPNGRKIRWDVEPDGSSDILHIKEFHPLSDWYGMSPMEAGAYSIDNHNEAQAWMKSLLANSARPSGILSAEGTLGDEQFHNLKEQLESTFQGASNAGRPMLLEGGMNWQTVSFSPSDMGIQEQKDSSARDICLAMGVPPLLIGIQGDNTYANYAEARLAFWEDSVTPLVNRLAEYLTLWLGAETDEEIRPNFDHIPAIAEKMASKWDMADKSTDLTVNERRALKGYEPIEGGDVLASTAAPEPDMNEDDQALIKAAYGTVDRL